MPVTFLSSFIFLTVPVKKIEAPNLDDVIKLSAVEILIFSFAKDQ